MSAVSATFIGMNLNFAMGAIMRLDFNELKKVKHRAESRQLMPEDYELLEALVRSHIELLTLLKDRSTSLDQLYQHFSRLENVPASMVTSAAVTTDLWQLEAPLN